MRIAFDFNAGIRQIAGIGRYARELVRSFAALESGDEIVLFYAGRGLDRTSEPFKALQDLQQLRPQVRTVALPFDERTLTILWQRARLPLPVELWTGAVDVVHAPDFVLPPVRRAATVLTVHDLSFRVQSEAAHPRLRRYLERAVPRSLARAGGIIAVSQSTARDLERLMGVAAAKITVIPHGIDGSFRRVVDKVQLEEVRQRFGLRQPFLLHVGTIEPRKNLVRLIRAFRELQEQCGAMIPELILAGRTGWLSDPIIAAADAAPGVRRIGPVSEADLLALYSLATALVYPSLYEGFGFPALEALACGTPVITANSSSLPEVVGDLGVLVDPTNEQALRTAMEQVINDPQHTARARAEGPTLAATFSWQRAAEQLLTLYQKTVHEHANNRSVR
ncbi:MAG: glycosyltransferase family 1 protein [Herpetosiphon sp.]